MTYWNALGRYQREADFLQTLIPPEGSIDGWPELEALRLGINAYYDAYNNGGANLRDGIIPNTIGAIVVDDGGGFAVPSWSLARIEIALDELVCVAYAACTNR